MRRAIFAGVTTLLATGAQAAGLPADIQGYVDRREACNYWTTERAGQDKHRRDEIAHHLRLTNCGTIDHEEAVLRARYRGDAAALQVMDQARDALPD